VNDDLGVFGLIAQSLGHIDTKAKAIYDRDKFNNSKIRTESLYAQDNNVKLYKCPLCELYITLRGLKLHLCIHHPSLFDWVGQNTEYIENNFEVYSGTFPFKNFKDYRKYMLEYKPQHFRTQFSRLLSFYNFRTSLDSINNLYKKIDEALCNNTNDKITNKNIDTDTIKALKQFLRKKLSIHIRESACGFNGKNRVFELVLDGEIISSDSYELIKDDD
jgi:hypothetical protein